MLRKMKIFLRSLRLAFYNHERRFIKQLQKRRSIQSIANCFEGRIFLCQGDVGNNFILVPD